MRDQFICRGNYGEFYESANYDSIELAHQLPDIDYINSERDLLSFSDYDMKQYMNSCINTKTDRATMRYSLELRSPLMDYRLAEYSRLLPINYLIDDNFGWKKILKDKLYDLVPRELFDRPKHGFAAPIGNWFKTSLRDQFIDTVNVDNVTEYLPELNPAKLIGFRDKFLNSIPSIHETSFLKVYNYIQWVKKYKK